MDEHFISDQTPLLSGKDDENELHQVLRGRDLKENPQSDDEKNGNIDDFLAVFVISFDTRSGIVYLIIMEFMKLYICCNILYFQNILKRNIELINTVLSTATSTSSQR